MLFNILGVMLNNISEKISNTNARLDAIIDFNAKDHAETIVAIETLMERFGISSMETANEIHSDLDNFDKFPLKTSTNLKKGRLTRAS